MWSRSPAAAAMVLALGLGLASAACSSGGDDDGATLGQTQPPTTPTAPPVPATSPAGTGTVVVGETASTFTVSGCTLSERPDDPGVLIHLSGAGTTAAGVPFQVEVQRFSAAGSAETYTDTITYTDSARILQALRFEVNGDVTDPRDDRARSVLLRTRPDGVAATGLAGPPGGSPKDLEGTVGLALDATC